MSPCLKKSSETTSVLVYTAIACKLMHDSCMQLIYRNICLLESNKTKPTHRRTDANLYPPERQLTKASEPLFDLEGGTQGQS